MFIIEMNQYNKNFQKIELESEVKMQKIQKVDFLYSLFFMSCKYMIEFENCMKIDI